MPLIQKPFIFIRHGETQANQDQLICGATDLLLNETGRQQALLMRDSLAKKSHCYDSVHCSAMLRAEETARLAMPDAKLHTDARLAERDWGRLECLSLKYQVAYEQTPPGGEPWEAFVERVTAAINDILTNFSNPLIVAHSGVYRVIQLHLTGTPHGNRVANATPVQFNFTDGQWQQSTRIRKL